MNRGAGTNLQLDQPKMHIGKIVTAIEDILSEAGREAEAVKGGDGPA